MRPRRSSLPADLATLRDRWLDVAARWQRAADEEDRQNGDRYGGGKYLRTIAAVASECALDVDDVLAGRPAESHREYNDRRDAAAALLAPYRARLT